MKSSLKNLLIQALPLTPVNPSALFEFTEQNFVPNKLTLISQDETNFKGFNYVNEKVIGVPTLRDNCLLYFFRVAGCRANR